MILEHEDVEKGDLVARYQAGRLEPLELEAFEEHYLHCARCLDQLEIDQEIGSALRIAAAQDAAAMARPLAVVAWLSRLSRSRQAMALVGALLVAFVLPLTWQQRQLAELRHERDRVPSQTATAGRAPAAPATDSGATGPSTQGDAERARLTDELERERRARAAAEDRLGRTLEPQANTPIVRLSPLRSLGGEPADRLTLDSGSGWVVLALELPASEYASYRVRLRRAGPAVGVVWTHAGLVPSAEGALVVSVHSSLLPAGDYEAVVEGLMPDGRGVPAGRFSLRIVAAARP